MPNLEERKREKSTTKTSEDVKEDSEAPKPENSAQKPKKSFKKKLQNQLEEILKALESSGEDSEDATKDSEASEPQKSAPKAPESDSDELTQLTAEKLNNELVGLRPFILKAKNQLTVKIVRQKKALEEKLKRMEDEIAGLKTIDRDTIAKFAAMNTKNLDQLKINGTTPLTERLMYKLACHDVVVSRIKETKEKYIEWDKTAAFFMQRLGQQYANKPENKKTSATSSGAKKTGKEDSEDDEDVKDSGDSEDDEEEDSDSGETPEEYDQSVIEIVDSDEEDFGKEADKHRLTSRQRLLRRLGLIDFKEDKSRPALKPKKRKLVEDDSDDVGAGTSSGAAAKKQKTKETVKQEMKKVLEKELKTKEPSTSRKSAPPTPQPSSSSTLKQLNTYCKAASALLSSLPQTAGADTLIEDARKRCRAKRMLVAEQVDALVATDTVGIRQVVIEVNGRVSMAFDFQDEDIKRLPGGGNGSFMYALMKENPRKRHALVYIDAKQKGNDSQYTRRSCKPNCVLKHAIGSNATLGIMVVATENIMRNVECTLPFDADWTRCESPLQCAEHSKNMDMCPFETERLREREADEKTQRNAEKRDLLELLRLEREEKQKEEEEARKKREPSGGGTGQKADSLR